VDPGPDPPARAGLHANVLPVNSKAPNLSFASQNLRSLNISTKNRITRDKIFAITREKQDIILLCDLKLNSNIQKAAVHDVEKYFFLNGYKLYHNSKHSTRGVGVLINRKISHSISNCLCDNDGNIIILELNLDVGNERLIVGSLYGTNQNEEGFFITVEQFLNQLNGPPIILGGDLNATWDNRNVNDNLDVHSMQNIPSIFRTNKIRSLCNTFNLVDPFRALYPNKKDFTYVPSVVNNHNRSRIDFFMITVTLIPYVKNCSISVGLLTTHFDHKCIFLNFKKKPVARTFPIKFSILKENEVSWQVTSSDFVFF
jgi:exonuclease III